MPEDKGVYEESLIWIEDVPVVVGDEPIAAGFFVLIFTVHCKKSTIHFIGSRNPCITSDIILKCTLGRKTSGGCLLCADRNEVETFLCE